MMRKSWPLFVGLIFTFLSVGLSLFSPPPKWLQRLDYLIYDIRFNAADFLHLSQNSEFNIVIVDIDEASLAQEGHWPWSRHRLAELVQKLADKGALVIGFDIVFSEAERNPVDELRQRIPQAQDLPAQWNQLVDGDQKFAQSLSATDTVLGFFFLEDASIQLGQLPSPVYALEDQKRPWVVVQKQGYAANLPVLQEQAQGGFVTTFSDADGVIRRTPLVLRSGEQLYPSLSLAMAMSYLLVDDVAIETTPVGSVQAMRSLAISDTPARTDAAGQVIVPYRGGARSFPYISAKDVLNDAEDVGVLEGALVLIGTSTMGLGDLRTTPLETQYPGVEVHANVLEGLLTGDFPYQPEWQAGAVVLQLLLVGLLLSLLLPKLHPLAAIISSLIAIGLLVASNFYWWSALGLDVPLALVLLLALVLAIFNLAYGFLNENRSRQQLRGMFDQYVPPAHIERMLEDPKSVQFQGESKELTVLFSDIRSFTSISEKLSASELKQMLNRYFTPITKSIFDHDGTIDKYVGDMVMAFWGAPLDDASHAEKAVACALDMQHILVRLREEFKQQGLPEIHAGIGLNTGDMNVGDMGSSYRRAYTVLGDAVNLGSRLESITKFYGAKILVSESTKLQATGFVYRFVDCIQVKGKEEPVNVYEPLGRPEDVDSDVYQQLELFNQAIEAYQQQQWEASIEYLTQLNQQQPIKLYEVYLERIEQLRHTPLPNHWDGVYRHENK